MKRIKDIAPVKKQLIKFGLIGLLAVLVDLCAYYIFLQILPKNVLANLLSNEAIAKTFSFLCGMSVTYTFNKLWTWKEKTKSKKRFVKFVILYGTSLLLNVGANSLFLYILHNIPPFELLPFKYLLAFIGATGISAILNFSGQKFWVFRDSSIKNATSSQLKS